MTRSALFLTTANHTSLGAARVRHAGSEQHCCHGRGVMRSLVKPILRQVSFGAVHGPVRLGLQLIGSSAVHAPLRSGRWLCLRCRALPKSG